MTSHIARDFPERSTTMLRGFGRVLDRAALVGGVVAVPLAALVSIAALSRLPFLISPIVGAVIGTIAGLVAWRLERWLAENPASPPMQIGRIEFLAYLGRLDEARAQYRHAADVTIALAESRERSMRADPAWSVPLADVRPSLGAAAAKVLRRDTVRPLAIIYFVAGLLAGAVAALLAILP